MADSLCYGYLIFIKNNGENGSHYPLIGDTCLIGSNVRCDVRLRDVNISDRHCLIKISPSKIATIHCVCNESPVLLNNEAVGENGSTLKNGDLIQIADLRFKWEENESYRETFFGRHSMNIEKNLLIETEAKRYSEPTIVFNQDNLDTAKKDNEPLTNGNNLNANECEDKTEVISETKHKETSAFNTSSVVKLISSSENSCNTNRESVGCNLNDSRKDICQVRRSRLFSQTYKTKSASKTPDKQKLTPLMKSCSKNTPLQESNRTPGREVKSRFMLDRSSPMKPVTASWTVGTGENMSVQEDKNDTASFVAAENNLDVEVENIVPKDEDIELERKGVEDEMTIGEQTFETTVPNGEVDTRSLFSTPKCFIEAFHSTPKAPEMSGSAFSSNSEKNEMTNMLAAHGEEGRINDLTQIYSLSNQSILASPVKSVRECDLPAKKKKDSDHSQVASDSSSRRHHTRNTSNLLRKTFEECSEDNLPMAEKSLTTPEKSNNENPALVVPESEVESSSPEKKVDSLNAVSTLSKFSFESTSELSAENGDAGSCASQEHREKGQKHDESSSSGVVARCSRNLSYISPPENNKSQEYMDSVIVSTPKKQSLDEASVACITLPLKESDIDVESSSTPRTPDSLARHRRSTGIVPCVGTPSEVYRTLKSTCFTPVNKSRFNRTSMEVEVSIGPRDSLSGFVKSSKFAQKRSSSERKSTPLKADKSTVRDSVQSHSPILEEYALECEESQNESLNNDSQYKFVSKRRRRLAKSSFGIADRIMEESELSQSDLVDEDGDEVMEEEGYDALIPLDSFEDENSEFASTRIVVNQTEGNDSLDTLNSTYSLDKPEEAAADDSSPTASFKPIVPKSILTPLPRNLTTMREKSAKKVTFFNMKADSLNNTNLSSYTATDADSDFNLHLSSSVANTPTDMSGSIVVNSCDESKTHSEDERMYLSDKSSEGCSSLNNSGDNKGSMVQKILAKREKIVKRLSSGRKSSKSPRVSGRGRKLNQSKSPSCLNVSGVQQLMKTPESLVKLSNIGKSATKTANVSAKNVITSETVVITGNTLRSSARLKTPEISGTKIAEPLQPAAETPDLRVEKCKPLAGRKNTPAPFGKRTKTPECHAERSKTPKILIDLVETPQSSSKCTPSSSAVTDVSALLASSDNESVKSVSRNACNRSLASHDDDDVRFVTPTARRCSKHLRIHLSSVCQSLVTSLNSSLPETSSLNCSASVNNSLLDCESAAENEVEGVPAHETNPKTTFSDVLVELKEKLIALQEKQEQADVEVLEKSINIINVVLVDKPASDNDMALTEEAFKNVLLELKERFSCSEKYDHVNRSVTNCVVATDETRSTSPVNDETCEVAGVKSSQTLEHVTVTEKSAVDVSSSAEVSNCTSVVSSKDDQFFDSAKSIKPDNDSGYAKRDHVRSEISNIVNTEEIVDEISVRTSVDAVRNASCVSHFDVHSDDSSVKTADVVHENSCHILSGDKGLENVENVSNDDVASLRTDVCNGSNVVISEEISNKIVDKTQSENGDVSIVGSRADMSVSTEKSLVSLSAQQSISTDVEVAEKAEQTFEVLADVPELDSQGLELVVTDSEEMGKHELENDGALGTSETPLEEDADNGCETTGDAIIFSKDENPRLRVVQKNFSSEGFLENVAEESQSTNKVVSATPSSLANDASAPNETLKTCTLASNHTLTAATDDIQEKERNSKIFDAIVAKEKSERFFESAASFLVHEENKENLLSLAPIAATDLKQKSIIYSPIVVERVAQIPPSTSTDPCELSKFQSSLVEAESTDKICAKAPSPATTIDKNDDLKVEVMSAEQRPIAAAQQPETANISLLSSSSYPSDAELDSTREENLTCVDSSIGEPEKNSFDSAANVSRDLKSVVAFSSSEEEPTLDSESTDAESMNGNVSTATAESVEIICSSKESSTAASSQVCSPTSTYVVPATAASLPASDVEMMVTPPRSAAVCVPMDKVDQLTLAAGPVTIAEKVMASAAAAAGQTIKTSTPLCGTNSQKMMEIPASCSTTIDSNVSPTVDNQQSAESSESSRTVVDEESSSSLTDAYDSQASENQTTQKTLSSEIAAETIPLASDANSAVTKNITDSVDESVSVASEAVRQKSDPAMKNTIPLKPRSTESNEQPDPAENKVPVKNELVTKVSTKTSTQSAIVSVLLDKFSNNYSQTVESTSSITSDDVSSQYKDENQENCAEKSSTYNETAGNEVSSARPKRGCLTKRYTELFKTCYMCIYDSFTTPTNRKSLRSKGESSTQSSKQNTKMKTKSSAHMDISVDLPRMDTVEEAEPNCGSKRKTVHFAIACPEPDTKRTTRSRNLVKAYIPTPERRRRPTGTDAAQSLSPVSLPPPTNSFGSPCAIVLSKIEDEDDPEAVECEAISSDIELSSPKSQPKTRKTRVNKRTKKSPQKSAPEPAKGGPRSNKVKVEAATNETATTTNAAENVAREEKKTNKTQTAKNVSRGKGKNETSNLSDDTQSQNEVPPKDGERRTRRKAADKVAIDEEQQITGIVKTGKNTSNAKVKNRDTESADSSSAQNVIPPKEDKRSRRKAAEVAVPKNTKKENAKAAVQSKDRNETSKAAAHSKSQSEVPEKEEKRPKGKAQEEKILGEKTRSVTKASKNASTAVKEAQKIQTMESTSSSRTAGQKKATEPIAETSGPATKSKRGAKVDVPAENVTAANESQETKTSKKTSAKSNQAREKISAKSEEKLVADTRVTRSRKDAAETSSSRRGQSKSTKSNPSPEVPSSKAIKRTASSASNSVDEVLVKRKRNQSPVVHVSPLATRSTRSRKHVEENMPRREPKVSLKRHTSDDSDDAEATTSKKIKSKTIKKLTRSASVVAKKKNDLSSQNVKSPVTRLVKEPSKKKNTVAVKTSPVLRVTRSRSVSAISRYGGMRR